MFKEMIESNANRFVRLLIGFVFVIIGTILLLQTGAEILILLKVLFCIALLVGGFYILNTVKDEK